MRITQDTMRECAKLAHKHFPHALNVTIRAYASEPYAEVQHDHSRWTTHALDALRSAS